MAKYWTPFESRWPVGPLDSPSRRRARRAGRRGLGLGSVESAGQLDGPDRVLGRIAEVIEVMEGDREEAVQARRSGSTEPWSRG